MACESEKENWAAGLTCIIGAGAGLVLAPGWWKLAAAAGVLSCMLWCDSARRAMEECMRANGKHAEADILSQHGEKLAAEISYLQSLGIQAA